VITSVVVTLPDAAVIVTFTALLTASEIALNPTLFAPAGTTTKVGTLSAASLLESVTVVESFATALRFTEHAVDCAPESDLLVQEIALSARALALYVTPPQPAMIETTHPASKANATWPMCLFLSRNESRK
jgi:hypothetical protein